MYNKDARAVIKSAFGRAMCCKICVFKAAKNPVVRWDVSSKNFKIVKLTLKERIKEFLKF
jgi:hypothetical protein